jgi:hypothetical protein
VVKIQLKSETTCVKSFDKWLLKPFIKGLDASYRINAS